MKVSYRESIANYSGLRWRCGKGNRPVLSVQSGGQRRPAIELRNLNFHVPIRSLCGEGNNRASATGEGVLDMAESLEPVHAWKSQSREPGEPVGYRAGSIPHRYGQRTVQRERLP
jgi:hypothetical protein